MNRFGGIAAVALIALVTGFLLAGQIKSELIPPSNRLARTQALVRSVQDLEKTNEGYRSQIAALRDEISALEADAAGRSEATQALAAQVGDLRAHAGLTAMHGPGVEVTLANGRPGPSQGGATGYLVNFEDVQDVVNLLFANGAEGVAVNGRRITPLSAFSGSEGEVVIDQGPPLFAPFKVTGIGDRSRMETAVGDPSALPDLRTRGVQFGVQLTFTGGPGLDIPAYDSSLEVRYATQS